MCLLGDFWVDDLDFEVGDVAANIGTCSHGSDLQHPPPILEFGSDESSFEDEKEGR